MSTRNICHQLSLAACTLVAANSGVQGQYANESWEVDTSYLSYSETDNRVVVSKTLANLVKQGESSSLSVSLIHDAMSGASPTGAIRSSNSAVTLTNPSGGGADASGAEDYSKSTFEDTRLQAGLTYQRQHDNGISMTYGGAVSQESDYDSVGANVSVARETSSKQISYNLGLAITSDKIFRSDTGGTPEPLSNVQAESAFEAGERTTFDSLLGMTRVLNKQTLAQFNVTLAQSYGYHSDPYKVVSAADSQDRILANFHDSRPRTRLRATLYTKLVHQLGESDHSVHISYRLYQDDWSIQSHTVDFRYRHQIDRRQFIEPHIRFYAQSKADFYQRKIGVDAGSNPVVPIDGMASADYRLDKLNSATIGLKYGVSIAPNTQLRIRAEYLKQHFSTADYAQMGAVILQASFKFRF